MDLNAHLILTLICLSTTFAQCPEKCTCDIYLQLMDRYRHEHVPVHCDNLQHLPLEIITSGVTVLQISSHNITVLLNIDEQVKNIPQLEGLELRCNHISKIDVNSLRVFTCLKHLDLSYNNISYIPNGLFKTLPMLTELDIDHNPKLILPENGFGIKELEHLDISYCDLQEIPLNFFDSTPNIKFLNLDGNHLSHLGSHLIKHFQKMYAVFLEYNNLTVLQPELTTLRNDFDVYITLLDNPFRCDCQFKDGITWHSEVHCVVPTESNNSNRSVDQEEFLESLDCDGWKNEDKTDSNVTDNNTTSYNNSNESLHNNTWITRNTALWIVLGVVGAGVLVVVIVLIVVRRRSLLNSEGCEQLISLQSATENRE